MNKDLIVPAIAVFILIILVVVWITTQIETWIEQEQQRYLERLLLRSQSKKQPLVALNWRSTRQDYVKINDDIDEQSAIASPVQSKAVDCVSDRVQTVQQSAHRPYVDREELVIMLAGLQYIDTAGKLQYLSFEAIARSVGMSKERCSELIRMVRGLPEPEQKPEPYQFEEVKDGQYVRKDIHI